MSYVTKTPIETMDNVYIKPPDHKTSSYTYTKKEMKDLLERQKYNSFDDKDSTSEPKKQLVLDPRNIEIYLKNFTALGEAITKAGGNPFMILKENDNFLRILANNNILLEKITYTKNE
jgi:hypothetical protein